MSRLIDTWQRPLQVTPRLGRVRLKYSSIYNVAGVDECRVSAPRGHVSGRCDTSFLWLLIRRKMAVRSQHGPGGQLSVCGHVVCIQSVAAGFTKCQVNVDAHTTYLRVHDLSAAIEGRGHERWARRRPAVVTVCVMDGW